MKITSFLCNFLMKNEWIPWTIFGNSSFSTKSLSNAAKMAFWNLLQCAVQRITCLMALSRLLSAAWQAFLQFFINHNTFIFKIRNPKAGETGFLKIDWFLGFLKISFIIWILLKNIIDYFRVGLSDSMGVKNQ